MLFQGKFKKETRDYQRYAECIGLHDKIDPLLLDTWLHKIREQQKSRNDQVFAQDLLPFDYILNELDRPQYLSELLHKTADGSSSCRVYDYLSTL